MDFYRLRYFLQSTNHKKKYRLTTWNIVCRPKDQVGFGIEVLDIKNRCLLSKWLFKLVNEEGMWQELLQYKYLKIKTLAQVGAKPIDSPFWKGILHGNDEFLKGDPLLLVMAKQLDFGTSLATQYPYLYATV
jgi:hypothetical protein